MTARTVFVPGLPITQGNHRANRLGHVYETTKGHKQWRERLHWAVISAGWHRQPILMGPVALRLDFAMPRPGSHFRDDGTLRPRVPYWHDKQPGDLDKLCRAVGDSLAGAGCIRNDSQIATLFASKTYSLTSGVTIHLEPIESPPEPSLAAIDGGAA
ncbi:MAG: RusA family crossover junction endodeoxyribonuclease [Candidatus Nanopelagicales bacterium]